MENGNYTVVPWRPSKSQAFSGDAKTVRELSTPEETELSSQELPCKLHIFVKIEPLRLLKI